MEFTYDNVHKWFESYFAEFNECNGDPEKVPNMEKYFTDNLQFISYIHGVKRPDNRQGLLNSMVHPGLLEDLKPEEMVIDERNRTVAVILRVQFREVPTNTLFPAKHNCAIYQLVDDGKGSMKIDKISYFTEHRSPEEVDMKSLMKKYREQSLSA
jgi:hypothetical protein